MELIKSINVEFTEEFKNLTGCLGTIIYSEDENERLIGAAYLFKVLQDINATDAQQQLILSVASAAYKGNTPDERMKNAKEATYNLCKPKLDKLFADAKEDDSKLNDVMNKFFRKIRIIDNEEKKTEEETSEPDDKNEKPEKEENPFETIANSLEKIVKVFEGSGD